LAKTLGDPDVMLPLSVLSPTRATGILFTNTLPEPTFITALCGTQELPDGMVWAEVGSPCLSIPILLAKTLPEGPVTVVVASHPCPVVVGSPSLAIDGII
jgi:hypothetical protein